MLGSVKRNPWRIQENGSKSFTKSKKRRPIVRIRGMVDHVLYNIWNPAEDVYYYLLRAVELPLPQNHDLNLIPTVEHFAASSACDIRIYFVVYLKNCDRILTLRWYTIP